ncbi:hypothetical protein O6H91_18G031900 [Diphasiastrum complanatum]|uniref:Uncharacterized protein n=2 Tax=Diphasiastrum complanatum TaxID=34168 RepID=A0ACC2AZU7_DIPCM|nr:hypothetical protein O6H91_18G031900 [Diphasiastrum complanatum]KAJ7522945.1 hypothetical protein O6H91_18G031900 [Diphasiastrum complanatum]
MEPLIPPPTTDQVDLMLKLRCGHMLHLTCFWHWFEAIPSVFNCPICRGTFQIS